jgi:hypothetical protein
MNGIPWGQMVVVLPLALMTVSISIWPNFRDVYAVLLPLPDSVAIFLVRIGTKFITIVLISETFVVILKDKTVVANEPFGGPN